MRNKILSSLAFVTLAVTMIQWLGCAFIGLGIGAKFDASKPYNKQFQESQLAKIKPGTQTELVLADGTKVKGSYIGTEATAADRTMLLQSAGDTTRVAITDISRISVKRSGRFRGFLLGSALDFVTFSVFQNVLKRSNESN